MKLQLRHCANCCANYWRAVCVEDGRGGTTFCSQFCERQAAGRRAGASRTVRAEDLPAWLQARAPTIELVVVVDAVLDGLARVRAALFLLELAAAIAAAQRPALPSWGSTVDGCGCPFCGLVRALTAGWPTVNEVRRLENPAFCTFDPPRPGLRLCTEPGCEAHGKHYVNCGTCYGFGLSATGAPVAAGRSAGVFGQGFLGDQTCPECGSDYRGAP